MFFCMYVFVFSSVDFFPIKMLIWPFLKKKRKKEKNYILVINKYSISCFSKKKKKNLLATSSNFVKETMTRTEVKHHPKTQG